MNENKYLTVSAINKYIKYRFDNDAGLKNIYLKAEISNVRKSKGFLYFVLKDEESELSAIMFPNNLARIKFEPTDGMQIVALGSVEAYHKKGTYSFLCNYLEEVGMGQAYLDFLKVKDKLAKEGLFEEKYKKKIPEYAQKIGVVTSANGDAINDIIFTFNNRFPLATIYLYPALVQGPDAPISLIKALNKANHDDLVGLIIIGRGGGALEDLACFNDEGLARAIFSSHIPIISAVGHEADYTICDFVADLRAPTPTGAAMLASISKEDIFANLYNINKHLNNSIKNKLTADYNRLMLAKNSYGLMHFSDYVASLALLVDNASAKLNMLSPLNILKGYEQHLTDLHHRINLLNLNRKIEDYLQSINNLEISMCKTYVNRLNDVDKMVTSHIDKLILLNPLNVLAKGYAVVFNDDKVVKSVNDVNKNDELKIKVSDGDILAIVK